MPFQRNRNNRRGGFRGGRGRRQFNDRNDTYKPMNKPKSEYSNKDQLNETEVGISEYISSLEGYSAVIKARFSDFQVNEINLEGKMAKLTDMSIPKSFASQEKKYSYKEVLESPLEKIPQETWEALRKLVESTDEAPVTLDADDFSKDDRKSVHVCVKQHFGREIVASTINKDGKSLLEFKRYDKKEKDTRTEWPENTPEYVHFILYKEMMDTMDVCLRIAKGLRTSPTKITYSGVKDRRAKTTQWLCLKRYEPSKLIQKIKFIRNIQIGNFEFKEKSLKIGELKGNRFRIALRNVKAEDELINKSLEHVKEHGFINYYGLQRFGNDKETPTFLIGIKLLQGQWKEAVDLILKVKAGDDLSYSVNQAKKLYAEKGDATAALNLCDTYDNCLEKKLLEGLAKNHDNDYVNALESIPRPMRLMYIHAFQSLIWNKMASKRIHVFGLKPVEGDLIFVDKSQEEKPLVEEEENDEAEDKDESTTIDEKIKTEKPLVRPLQADELDKYTIHDIVLPLPGYDITYPENMKPFYKEAIEECGLALEMPQQKVRSYNLSGTYRKLCQQVQDMDWKILYYSKPTDNLIRSDLEEMNGEEEPKSVENGEYKAIVLSFTLNASSYATMVLREILKVNTSSSYQAEFNNYADSKNKNFEIDEIQPGSLLADKKKYEDFKNSLFKDILEDTDASSIKREQENGESDASSIKMELENGESDASGIKRELENGESEVNIKKIKVEEECN